MMALTILWYRQDRIGQAGLVRIGCVRQDWTGFGQAGLDRSEADRTRQDWAGEVWTEQNLTGRQDWTGKVGRFGQDRIG
jgi:hypothetical protein